MAYFAIFILSTYLLQTVIRDSFSVPANPTPYELLIQASVRKIIQASCAVFALWIMAHLVERKRLSGFGFERIHILRDLLLGVALGIGLTFAIIGVEHLIGWYHILGRNPSAAAPVTIVMFTFLVAVAEETTFRGYVFQTVETSWGTGTAVALSSALFGLLHVLNPDGEPLAVKMLNALSIALGAGLPLSAAYLLTRRLWMPIGLHWAFDAVELLLTNPDTYSATALVVTTKVSTAQDDWVMLAIGTTVGVLLLRQVVRSGQWRGRLGTAPAESKLDKANT